MALSETQRVLAGGVAPLNNIGRLIGRLNIDGPLEISFGRVTTLEARGIRFANPDWAQSPELFRAGRLRIGIDLPSLFSNQPRLTEIVLEDCAVALERAADAHAVMERNDSFGKLGLGDAIPPTLELLGARSVEIEAGSTFDDPGVAAMDDIDGDITDKIEVSGVVDSTVVGTQTITYSVADRAGNSAIASRTVIVSVDEGRGGGGGGLLTPFFIMLLTILLAASRMRRRSRMTVR